MRLDGTIAVTLTAVIVYAPSNHHLLFPTRKPHTMLTRDDMTRIALRYDTALSRAMLRALGVPIPHRVTRGTVVRADKVDGGHKRKPRKRKPSKEVRDCMEQRFGVRL